MKKHKVLRVLFFMLIFSVTIGETLACMYGPPYKTVCETYAEADLVIIGKIESVKSKDFNHMENPKPEDFKQTVSIKVKKTYKGKKLDKIVLDQPLSTCDWDFSDEEGNMLLLYLRKYKKTKKYSAIAQGMGGRVEHQSENIYWLDNLPNSLKRTRLSGSVELYQDKPFRFINYLVGTKVKVFNDKNSFEVFTDKNGVYEIWDIPLGKYRIQPFFQSNYELDLDIEKGLIDFDSLKKIDPKTDEVLVEIQSNGCGGIDFIANEKVKKSEK